MCKEDKVDHFGKRRCNREPSVVRVINDESGSEEEDKGE